MKRILALILTLALAITMCACSTDKGQPSATLPATTTPANPPQNSDPPEDERNEIDLKTLITAFPFVSSSLHDAEAWFENNNYTIKETDTLNSSIEAAYGNTPKWRVFAGNNVYGVNGFHVQFIMVSDLTEDEEQIVFSGILDQLNELCGSPVNTQSDSNNHQYDYNGLTIIARSTGMMGMSIEMSYKY